jgi:glucose/arabinose dehydrogenase
MFRRWHIPLTSVVIVAAGALASSCAATNSSGAATRDSATPTVASQAGAPTTNSARGARSAAAPHRGVRLVELGSFDQPTYVTGPPGDRRRVFVVQKSGQIRVLRDGHELGAPFLDISQQVASDSSERGLLSIAFAPDYISSGAFYVDYTAVNGDIHIERYQRSAADPDKAEPSSARTVVVIAHHLYPNHNGGQLQFGPDHDLYVGVGDGGSEDDPQGNGQNTDTLLGKLLRIAPKRGGGYSIPAGNPFAGRSGARPEIWAYGLRNPWRFSFDRGSGALIIGDVGQDQQEELDFAPAGTGAGANYGWSVFEGDRRNKPGGAPHALAPLLVSRHSAGNCAIIGGYVVRDRALAGLYGQYLYSDICKSQIRAVKLAARRARGDHATGLSVKDISSFGQDGVGRIYAASLDGQVYRLAAK